jgi:hypothetical protein
MAARGRASSETAALAVARPVLWTSRTEQGYRYGRRPAPANVIILAVATASYHAAERPAQRRLAARG